MLDIVRKWFCFTILQISNFWLKILIINFCIHSDAIFYMKNVKKIHSQMHVARKGESILITFWRIVDVVWDQIELGSGTCLNSHSSVEPWQCIFHGCFHENVPVLLFERLPWMVWWPALLVKTVTQIPRCWHFPLRGVLVSLLIPSAWKAVNIRTFLSS